MVRSLYIFKDDDFLWIKNDFVRVWLWTGVVHQRSSVRCTTAELFGCAVVRVIDEKLTISRIAPAIVTLANDTDL